MHIEIAPGGWRLAVVPFVIGGVLAGIAPIGALVFGLLGLAVLWFHRDPPRTPPQTGLIAPADGTVTVLRQEGDRIRVGIFMNLDDVHVVRSPTAGTVEDLVHEPGAHRPAFSKESDRNERLIVTMQTPRGPQEVTLIAGAFARRIHPYIGTGDQLSRGQRLGHISFGSRVDVLCPPSITIDDVCVEPGTPVTAGETVLAERPQD